MPWTDPRAQEYTLFELTKLYWEDVYEADPKALWDASRNERGDVIVEETGDPLIDKWEKEIAMGLTPDLMEGMSEAARAEARRQSGEAERAEAQLTALTGDAGRAWRAAAKMAPGGER